MKRILIWWRRLWVMTAKELLQLSRDNLLLLFIVHSFTLDVYFSGSGVGFDLKNAPMLVQDSDRSFSSRELISRFQSPYFNLQGEVKHHEEGGRLLDQGKAMIILDIPPRFEESLLKGETASVQMQVDTSNSVLGLTASSYAGQIVNRFAMERGLERSGLTEEGLKNLPAIKDEQRVWYNPNQDETWFMAISEMLQMITLFAIMLPATAMAREKERGTVEQLLVSPLSPVQIMFSKVLAMTAVILVGTTLCIFSVIGPAFHVPIKGSLTLFFAVTTLYVFTTAGLGLFAATISSNMAQAGMLTTLILAPMLLLSGIFTPPEAMPLWLRTLILFSPLNHYIIAAYGILLKGAGLAILWDTILAMALLGGGIFAFGVWRLKRQFG